MKLRDYLTGRGLTISGFAAEIGEKQPVLSRVVSGKRSPSFRLMQKIHAATSGEVTLNDFDPPRNGAESRPSEAA